MTTHAPHRVSGAAEVEPRDVGRPVRRGERRSVGVDQLLEQRSPGRQASARTAPRASTATSRSSTAVSPPARSKRGARRKKRSRAPGDGAGAPGTGESTPPVAWRLRHSKVNVPPAAGAVERECREVRLAIRVVAARSRDDRRGIELEGVGQIDDALAPLTVRVHHVDAEVATRAGNVGAEDSTVVEDGGRACQRPGRDPACLDTRRRRRRRRLRRRAARPFPFGVRSDGCRRPGARARGRGSRRRRRGCRRPEVRPAGRPSCRGERRARRPRSLKLPSRSSAIVCHRLTLSAAIPERESVVMPEASVREGR